LGDTFLVSTNGASRSAQVVDRPEGSSGRDSPQGPPEWISSTQLLRAAYALAGRAHGQQRRPSDNRLFLEHVTEVAGLLQQAGFDDELIAIGLLHDAVERGTLEEGELRAEMGNSISSMVMTLSEDPTIEAFDRRKAALREQVAAAGGRAVTVFAADKLSDIAGLRRGLEASPGGLEARLDTSAASMTGHYRDSVEMIGKVRPGSAFLAELRQELDRLEAIAA
jgi:hypothetical protein